MSRKDKLKKLERQRQRGKIDRHRQSTTVPASDRFKNIILLEYDVSFEPLGRQSPEWDEIASIDHDELEKAGSLVYSNAAAAVEQLRPLLDLHPGAAILTQWLITALQKIGRDTEADTLIELNYTNHPEYLFAKLQYALLLMHHGDLEIVEKMFDRKMELKLLYPERTVFHISEVTSFNAFAVQFFIRKGMLPQAEIYFDILARMAPRDGNTKVCEKMLNGALLLQSLKKASTSMIGRGLLNFGR